MLSAHKQLVAKKLEEAAEGQKVKRESKKEKQAVSYLLIDLHSIFGLIHIGSRKIFVKQLLIGNGDFPFLVLLIMN